MSIFASPYTDAFCVQAINLILDALPRAYARRDRPRGAHRDGERGDDRRARVLERVRRRQPRARPRGRRALRHRARARQRASSCRTCCATTPRCRASSCPRRATRRYVAPEKYAQIAWVLGLGGRQPRGAARAAVRARRRAARRRSGSRARWRSAGVPRDEFDAALPDLARAAFVDPSMRTNPRIPLVARASSSCCARATRDARPRARSPARRGRGGRHWAGTQARRKAA